MFQKISFLAVFIFSICFAFGQNENKSSIITLVNSDNSKRIIKIDTEKYHNIEIAFFLENMDSSEIDYLKTFIHNGDSIIQSDLLDTKSVKLFGQISSLDGDKLQLKLTNKETTFKLGKTTSRDILVSSTIQPKISNEFETIALENISFINLQVHSRKNKIQFGRSLLIGSAITSLVVAPLAGLLVDDSNFNNSVYYSVTGIGLGGMLISIPLVRMRKHKFYKITTNKNKNSEYYWYFQTE